MKAISCWLFARQSFHSQHIIICYVNYFVYRIMEIATTSTTAKSSNRGLVANRDIIGLKLPFDEWMNEKKENETLCKSISAEYQAEIIKFLLLL